jgi:hypothetical protein
MDLNQVQQLAQQALTGGNDFADMRWDKYRDNNKEGKRPDLWTFTMIEPAKAIYYPGDEILNARLDTVSVQRNSWQLHTGDSATVRGYHPLGGQPNGFVDMSGSFTLNLTDKQDYAIELWIKNTRDLISNPETRFSYPVELLMCQAEVAFHNTVQQRVKVWNFLNAVPRQAAVGQDAPQNGDVSWGADNNLTWNFPWHTENYVNIY